MKNTVDEVCLIVLNTIEDEVNVDVFSNTELLTSGLIDSFRVLEILNRIERKFDIRVDDELVIVENLNTIDSIANMVDRIKKENLIGG